MKPSILMVAFEAGRWGPARLVQQLTSAGFTVNALCPTENALTHSSHLAHHYALSDIKSSRHLQAKLRHAMEASAPALVVPCDERAVAALHAIVKCHSEGVRVLNNSAFEVLLKSLAKRDMLDAVLMKDKTLALAQTLGISVPQSKKALSAEEATNIARQMGFPVYVKSSFSWAGLGTIECRSDVEVGKAFSTLSAGGKAGLVKSFIRKLLARDWYPTDQTIEIQKSASGKPAMYCAIALEGKLLAGFSGLAEQTSGNSGPSTIVRLGNIKAFETAARNMIEATELSGFVGFDFMWDEEQQTAVLLECNPRPIQVCHLGEHLGKNLCIALAKAIAGSRIENHPNSHELVVPLFPQEWLRDEQAALEQSDRLDVPKGDSKLMEFMLSAGRQQGRSVDKLCQSLKQ